MSLHDPLLQHPVLPVDDTNIITSFNIQDDLKIMM